MSSGWTQVPLGDVIRHRKEFTTINDLVSYRRCRVQLHARGVTLRDQVPGATIKTKLQQVCRSGDFLVAEIDAKHGGYGMVPPELDGAIVSSHYFLFEVDSSRLDRSFLEYFIRTPAFRDQVAAQGSTNYAAIRPSHVLSYQMPLPSLPEQRRIVARVGAIVAKITEASSLRGQVSEAFGSFIASTHVHLAAGRTVVLEDILELHEVRNPVVSEGIYPQVGCRGFGEGLFPRENLRSDQTTYKHFNRLYAGAIVLSQVKGWEGAVAVCPHVLSERFVSPEYRTFRCRPDEALPEYLASLVPTPWFWKKLKDITRGVGARRERTRPEQFLAMPLLMPQISAQRRALRLFDKLSQAQWTRNQDAGDLDALLPSILDRAFRGEL